VQVLKSVAGVHSLKNLAATASSARVLDLHALATEDPDDPDYLRRPLFSHPLLNRSIIVKHNARPGAEDRLAPRRCNATKVIFPFDPQDLGLGGQFLFVDQPDFEAALARHLDYTDLPLERDIAVLRAVDQLPTLDPFLVREMLNQQRIEVGRCYYRITSADRAEMLRFVAGEMEALIRACFGELKTNGKRTRRLAQLLLANQDSPELEPLRETFRMEASEFSEAMFSWKAFLYYHWRARALAPMLKSTLKSICGVHPRRYQRDDAAFATRSKARLQKTLLGAWRQVGKRLKLYDRAFASLTDGREPDGFRSFLIRGPGLFSGIGHDVGRLEQAVSYWGDRFGGGRIAEIAPDDVLDGMRDLLQALATDEVRQRAEPGVQTAAEFRRRAPLPPRWGSAK
jgi:hypothetical protein